ncbi:MAG: ABC transporter permease, partial [Acidobacteriota bacterium]|nr:ABC transporter permease [Acidobacteriota bacterium]
IGLGRFLAEGAVTLIAGTVNALYTSSSPAPIALTTFSIVTALAAGMLVAVLSALGPAREAMSVSPTEAMGRGAREYQASLKVRRDLLLAGLLALLAIGASQFPASDGRPVAGYVATLLSIIAAALAAPAVVLIVVKVLRPAARMWFGAEGLLAGRSLTASLGRTSVVVAALATAISMMAAVGIMVGSFRETVLVWLDTQLKADLYVRPAGPAGAGLYPALPPGTAERIAHVSGVMAVDVFHGFEFRYQGQRATLGAGNLEIVRRFGRLRFLPGQNRESILESMPNRDRVIVSEPFANKHRLRAGDHISISLGPREVPVTIAGVYYEYSSDRGYVIFDRSTLLKYLPNQPATNIAIYVKPGMDAAAVRRAVLNATASLGVVVAPNEVLRKQAVIIFDRTFAITYALEGVAIVVAMLGAANSLLALVLDRRRELGLLRYLGASASQIRRMILVEAGFLGLLANLLGLALGFALSLLLIYVINKQSFGWTIQFHPPIILLAGALSLVWCVTIVAGLYPARVASRLNPIEVIHEE